MATAVLVGWLVTSVTGLLAQGTTPVTEGDVVKIDLSPGMVTVRHGSIENLGLPNGTSDFHVGDAIMLNAVRLGDHIKFTADRVDGRLTITALKP